MSSIGTSKAKARFTEKLDLLIRMVEASEPGLEFATIGEGIAELTGIAQNLGHRIGMGGEQRFAEIGSERHKVSFLLAFPASDKTKDIRLYEFNGPATIWIGDADNGGARNLADIERAECKAVKYGEIERHITTPQERALILTWLKQWRAAVAVALGPTVCDAPAALLNDPVPISWLRERVTQKAVKGDASKLTRWLKRRQVRMYKIAGRWHAEKEDLLKAFAGYSKVKAYIREHGEDRD